MLTNKCFFIKLQIKIKRQSKRIQILKRKKEEEEGGKKLRFFSSPWKSFSDGRDARGDRLTRTSNPRSRRDFAFVKSFQANSRYPTDVAHVFVVSCPFRRLGVYTNGSLRKLSSRGRIIRKLPPYSPYGRKSLKETRSMPRGEKFSDPCPNPGVNCRKDLIFRSATGRLSLQLYFTSRPQFCNQYVNFL